MNMVMFMLIEMADLKVKFHPIRGGTDGARLSEKLGIPLQKAAEVIINLAYLWSLESKSK